MNSLLDDDDPDEKLTRELLEETGRRPPPPEEDLAAIKRAARAVWEERYAARRPGFWPGRRLLPLAAGILGGLLLTWWIVEQRSGLQAPISIGQVDRVIGPVVAWPPRAKAEAPIPLAAGQPVISGSVIETSPGARAALRVAGGPSLRLDAATRVRLTSAGVVTLEHGAVYLDSPVGSTAAPMTVRTVAGDFAPEGTQFEVRVDPATPGAAHLRVREGRVRLQRAAGSLTAVAGQELIVGKDGRIVRGGISPDARSWSWVAETVPMFQIEGRTLRAFLDWIAREQGWTVRYTGREAASAGGTITLHGSIDQLSLPDALRTVMLSSGFEYRVAEGVLVVSAARTE